MTRYLLMSCNFVLLISLMQVIHKCHKRSLLIHLDKIGGLSKVPLFVLQVLINLNIPWLQITMDYIVEMDELDSFTNFTVESSYPPNVPKVFVSCPNNEIN